MSQVVEAYTFQIISLTTGIKGFIQVLKPLIPVGGKRRPWVKNIVLPVVFIV